MQALKKGDTIRIVAPAGRILGHELDFAKNWAAKHGWQLRWNQEMFSTYDFGYFYAGTDELRFNEMQEALDECDSQAIWMARGGYGSVKIIDRLNFAQFIQKPKWLIGYSDITVFHNHLSNLNIPSLHAVTAKQLNTAYNELSYTSLARALNGESMSHEIPMHPLNTRGMAQGKLVGGNLSILYSQLGSQTALQGDDLILFIEDWQENWYHLDRMMMALKRSGLFHRLSGVLVGSFTKMDIQNENPEYNSNFDTLSEQIIAKHLAEFEIPVAFGFPAGHIGDNRCLIMGQSVSLNVGETTQIKTNSHS